jgi:hypothetical protein
MNRLVDNLIIILRIRTSEMQMLIETNLLSCAWKSMFSSGRCEVLHNACTVSIGHGAAVQRIELGHRSEANSKHFIDGPPERCAYRYSFASEMHGAGTETAREFIPLM